MPTEANFYALLLFGAIGLAAFIYGKNARLPKKMILGGVLMLYPYFVSQTWLLWSIGAALTAGLVFWKE